MLSVGRWPFGVRRLASKSTSRVVRVGKSVEEIYESLVFDDIRHACDIFRPIYEETDGLDGYVSIEVPPSIAHDTQGTIQEAIRLNLAGSPKLDCLVIRVATLSNYISGELDRYLH